MPYVWSSTQKVRVWLDNIQNFAEVIPGLFRVLLQSVHETA